MTTALKVNSRILVRGQYALRALIARKPINTPSEYAVSIRTCTKINEHATSANDEGRFLCVA
jgi:uncharacterized membrane-anchored protein